MLVFQDNQSRTHSIHESRKHNEYSFSKSWSTSIFFFINGAANRCLYQFQVKWFASNLRVCCTVNMSPDIAHAFSTKTWLAFQRKYGCRQVAVVNAHTIALIAQSTDFNLNLYTPTYQIHWLKLVLSPLREWGRLYYHRDSPIYPTLK